MLKSGAILFALVIIQSEYCSNKPDSDFNFFNGQFNGFYHPGQDFTFRGGFPFAGNGFDYSGAFNQGSR